MGTSRELGIVEPNGIVRAGLKQILSTADFRVSLEYGSIEEVWNCPRPVPKVAALLINVERESYPSDPDIARLRAEFPEGRIVLLVDSSAYANAAYAIRHGIDGLIFKTSRIEAIVKAVELAVLGERVFPAAALQALSTATEGALSTRQTRDKAVASMSAREIEVLKDLCSGSPNKVIARNLGISEATVKVHVKAILRKSRAKNRTEAALWGAGLGLAGAPRGDAIGREVGGRGSGLRADPDPELRHSHQSSGQLATAKSSARSA